MTAETSKPAGKITTILPLFVKAFVVVKLTVTLPVAAAASEAGSTSVLVNAPTVIVSAVTAPSSSIVTSPAVVVRIVYVPVLPEPGGFVMFPNTTLPVSVANSVVPPVRVTVTVCPLTPTVAVPSKSLPTLPKLRSPRRTPPGRSPRSSRCSSPGSPP